MSIDYRFSVDHPIGKGASLLLLLIVGFFGFVNVMSHGNYGYSMGLESYLPLIVFVLFFGFKYRVSKNTDTSWVVTLYFFGLKMNERRVSSAGFRKDGKFWILSLKRCEEEISSSILLSDKDVELYKLFLDLK